MAAKVLPEPGTSLKQTTYTEVVPQSVTSKEKDQLSFWEYMAELKPEDYGKHIVYAYRWLDNGEVTPSAKLTVPFDEFELKDMVGGGNFRLIMKRGPQICKRIEKYPLEGPRKDPEEVGKKTSSSTSHPGNGQLSDIALVMQRQTDLLEKVLLQNNGRPVVEEAMRGALQLQQDGFRSVVTSVREMSPQPVAASAPDPMRDLMTQFMTAAIAKMMNPADPIEAFSKMATAFSSLNLGERGSTSVGVELIRALPSVAQHISSGIQAYSAAQLEAARMATAPNRALPASTASQQNTQAITIQPIPGSASTPQADAATVSTAQPAAATQAAPPPQGGNVASPNLEWIELKIVEIIMNQELSAKEAASEALTFLQVAAPNIRDQLVAAGENGVNWLFNNRAILMQVPKNPRLSEFIAKFLELGSGVPAPEAPPITPEAAPVTSGA